MKTMKRSIPYFFAMMLLALPCVIFAQTGHSVWSDNQVRQLVDPISGTTFNASPLPSMIDSSSAMIVWTDGTPYGGADISIITDFFAPDGGTYKILLDTVTAATAASLSGLWVVEKNGAPITAFPLPGTVTGLNNPIGGLFVLTIPNPAMLGGGNWVVRARITNRLNGVLAPTGIEGSFCLNGSPLVSANVRLNQVALPQLTDTTDASGLYEFPTVTNLANVNSIVMNTALIQIPNTYVCGIVRFNNAPVAGATVRIYSVTPMGGGVTLLETTMTDASGFFQSNVYSIPGMRFRVQILP